MLSASVNPSSKAQPLQSISTGSATNSTNTRPSFERDALQPPMANGGRSLAASAVSFAPRGSSLNPSPMPNSFASDLRVNIARVGSRPEAYGTEKLDEMETTAQDQALAQLRDALTKEMKIKEGSENLLEALKDKKAKPTKEQRQRVEAEIQVSNQRIRDLRLKIASAQRNRLVPSTPTRARADGLFQNTNVLRSPPSASRSGAGSEVEEPTESPTFALAEILQALEASGMTPEYYVSRANNLVDLFKRHPTLKYDLVWSVFGVRMQVMLLSESREIVAAGYRMLRYAVSDITSLRKIRTFNTDYLVTWSLIKDRKSDVEREQALKFVRAFLDIKDGVREISRAVVRTMAALAEDADDRLRPICVETLAEILVQDPRLVIGSGGLLPLHEALVDGSYKATSSLAGAFMYLLDAPERRKYLKAGNQLEAILVAFTDSFAADEQMLKQASKAVSSVLRTWTGLFSLSMYNFRAIRSLVQSMVIHTGPIRETVLDLLYSLLRIKSPGWATSFLAGRRLTTYGRVSNLRSTPAKGSQAPYGDDDNGEQNFVEHYTALLLAILVQCGLVPSLLKLTEDVENTIMKRKATLLIGEVLKMSTRLLPPLWSSQLQLLPELFNAAAHIHNEQHFTATGVVYQISSVSKTLYRSSPTTYNVGAAPPSNGLDMGLLEDQPKATAGMVYDEATFRQLLIESNVLSSSNFTKWNWDVVLKIIEGPLANGKRVEEAVKASKFLKRIISFYRPFKYKFSDQKNNRTSQKYVKVGCALMHTLLQTPEGVKYLADNKLLRQVAECLAQCDPTSGLTAQYPVFAKDRLVDSLSWGYFPMLGVLSGDPKGIQMLDRWRIFNMMYHIVDLKQRPDLIKLMLANFDYSLQGHPRVLLSKALTAGEKDIRIGATDALRKYATRTRVSARKRALPDSKWAIQLLVTQLYDPEVEVCATAVKILETACISKDYLEYIVECRPALDHLGEIGAPLLLRFLSTSIGYHYLDGLDYISNEMDDWFLGRNDAYVGLIEASLARSFTDPYDEHRLGVFDEEQEIEVDSLVPPHFYRELTRTEEGCKLLREKGHFKEFADIIRECGMQSEDAEMLVKVKGCLWAVGNVGSMELGAPFLESCDVVAQIVRIAQTHEMLSLRGTAFFVLGLISRSVHGLEMLSEHGWDANTTAAGTSLGFCIPTDLTKLFSLQTWANESVMTMVLPQSQQTESYKLPPMPSRPRSESLIKAMLEDGEEVAPRVELDPDPMNQRILELVLDLSNMVVRGRAANELLQIKASRRAAGFRQPRMFRRVMALLETHHVRLADRSMVVGFFDKSVLRSIIFGGDEDENAEGLHLEPRQNGEGAEGAEGAEDEDACSSGDEQRTERQRSISDPADLERRNTVRRVADI